MEPHHLFITGYEAQLKTFRINMADMYPVTPMTPTSMTLDGVGGCTTLVHADLHRQGAIFPAWPVDHQLETEGALSCGCLKLSSRMSRADGARVGGRRVCADREAPRRQARWLTHLLRVPWFESPSITLYSPFSDARVTRQDYTDRASRV